MPAHIPPPRPSASQPLAALDEERLGRLLEPWVRGEEDRAFVVRCILREGPHHHRGASYALLALLGEAVEGLDPAEPRAEGPAVGVPLRLPPHAAPRGEEAEFPLRMATGALERLAPRGSREFDALVGSLLDGPPHHALANAAMVCLLDELLRRLAARRG